MPKKFSQDWTEKIKKMREQTSGGGNFKDNRIYFPEYKEDGTAKATIRFLEAPDVDVPMIAVYSHYFKGVGGWFVENCPTTIGGQCPVCEDNSNHWNNEGDAGQEFVRNRRSSRVLSYYTNILVVNDEKTPSNNGKIFLFKLGKKIFKKVEEAIDDDGMVPWDELCGVNFILKITKEKLGQNMVPNYDSSYFVRDANGDGLETPLSKYGDLEKIKSTVYKLGDYVDPKNYKSYDELKIKFNSKINGVGASTISAASIATTTSTKKVTTIEDTVEEDIPVVEEKEDKVFAEDDDKGFFDNMEID
jgi:hypothetical protein